MWPLGRYVGLSDIFPTIAIHHDQKDEKGVIRAGEKHRHNGPIVGRGW